MKAVLLDGFGGADVMRVGEVDVPEPAAGQVLIEVAATSVNRADVTQRQGNYPPPPGESEILGLEVAGTIAAWGAGVDGWQVGDRVMSLVGGGGYAELAVAYADHLIPVPEGMSFEQAACVCETYITAFLNVFELGGLEDGDAVLLHGGGGGVNTAAVQLCGALIGRARILVTASPGKIERVYGLGVDLVIDYTAGDFSAAVRQHTDNRGVDVILDHIGAKYLAPNLASLAVGGRLVIIGLMGGAKAELNLGRLMVKRQHVIGSVLRARSAEEKTAITARFRQRVMPLFEDGTIAPLIHEVVALEDAADAHRTMESGGHFGKIVLAVGAA